MKKLIAILAMVFIPAFSFAAETTAVTDREGNLVITVTVTPNEQKYMENDLLSIKDWVQGAIVGKVNKCKGRMVSEWDAKLKADKSVTSIPTDETQWLTTVTSREDYKNRVQKEAK